MIIRKVALTTATVFSLYSLISPCAFSQGTLTPTGTPGATMQTLDQLGAKSDQINAKADQLEAKAEKRLPIHATGAPIFITISGSYYLTANITFKGNGLVIGGDNITVDLNGFSLIGPGSGTNHGITISGAHKNIVIRNGIIRSFGGSGISGSSGDNMTIEYVTATSNGASVNPASGIWVGTNCRISDCTATANLNGVSAGNDAVITRVIANSNNSNGIVAGSGGTVQFSSASKNGNFGIQVGNDVTVSNCSASANTARGITAADGCVITNCTAAVDGAYSIYTENSAHVSHCNARVSQIGIRVGDNSTINDCTASANTFDGIQAVNACFVMNNNASGNVSPDRIVHGIHLFGARNRVDTNMVTNNGFGILSAAGTGEGADFIIRNIASHNGLFLSPNYSPATGSNVGPTDKPPGTATSPWANFQ